MRIKQSLSGPASGATRAGESAKGCEAEYMVELAIIMFFEGRR